ncbi:hypothetical protein [Urechidicola vernalis]|uniref:Tetratricopeptide repeat protein n=1 Tax=Urechidicola vernalis TaxID=3075600 RepID=A0ABU2Y7B7_9FLAO|nr:hypothetical protein [Urechidicola sp. P050]MDT0552928.1 hypothetical protein [Urechidicola sp. P050]
MATEKKDALFTLIKSLSKSEKRQFKLYAGRLGGNTEANFIALFNVMDKQQRYDERGILQNTNIKKQQLSNSKAHLYKQLLISLRLSPLHQNVRSLIREQIEFATILYNKGLYKHSLKLLDKAKSSAIENEEDNLAYEIVELEKVIESQYITRSLSNRADTLSIQAKELSMRNVMTSKLSNLSLQLYSWLLRNGYAKSIEDIEQVTHYFNSHLPTYKISELGFKEKLFLYKAYLWYSLITQDFVASYRYSQKWIDIFNDKPSMKNVNPVFYLKGYNYLLESLFMIKHHKKFRVVLDGLRSEMELKSVMSNENTLALATVYYYQNKLNLYFLEADFEDGVKYVPIVLDNIEAYKKKIDAHHVMVFYYKIACMYFGVSDYKNSIIYLEKIISNKELSMREDLLCFSRVLNLVAHYEAGLDENIDVLIKSTFRFLIKMNDLHLVQRKMIDFLKSLSDLYPSELKSAFKKLRDELKEYENHPYEKRSFLYLDIISWLESNIEGVPIQTIISRKNSKLLPN